MEGAQELLVEYHLHGSIAISLFKKCMLLVNCTKPPCFKNLQTVDCDKCTTPAKIYFAEVTPIPPSSFSAVMLLSSDGF